MADTARRIGPRQAHERLEADPAALLVCAYDDVEKFEKYHLHGAISLDEFRARADSLPRNREIIFYCA